MAKQIKVVIGSTFGDEGKGLMTDYFCHQLSQNGRVLNIRHNGGAQAGHTVKTSDGKRNVFSHFGAGSFNPHVDTYLAEEFILNPILFCKELERLQKMGVSPRVYINPNCRITTPYDMLINQIVERNRGEQRHGSCGLGINETVVRYQEMGAECAPLVAGKVLSAPVERIASYIRTHWVPKRLMALGVTHLELKDMDLILSDNIIDNWASQLRDMMSYCYGADSSLMQNYDGVVFEGAQGILLDTDNEAFAPHLTSSRTGSQNPKDIIVKNMLHDSAEIEFCYVTRTYFTRHGAGDFPSECEKSDILTDEIVDKTNSTNQFQGALRYGYFDEELFWSACLSDAHYLRDVFSNAKHSIAVTHMDETVGRLMTRKPRYPEPITLMQEPITRIYKGGGETRECVSVLAEA